jgi:flagellar hook-associated protein 2
MATITSAGIGSGLDIENIVTQLVALERQPIDNLRSDKSITNAQISAFGSLKSKVSEFQTAMKDLSSLSSFQVFNATSNDESVFTAEVGSAASAGSHSVDVVQLAERDKIATKAYTDANTFVGEGTLTISTGTDSFNVLIDSSNNTVQGIRDAINSASDNTGVTATIVNDDNGAQLVISTDGTGSDNALKIEVADASDASNTDDAGLSALAYEAGVVVHRTEISTNKDSIIKVDGFTSTNSTNTVSGLIEGITFTANAIGTSTLDITRDDDAITESVQAFADAFNALRSEINTQRSGQLEADSTLLSMERQLFDILNSGAAITGSNQSYLVEVGLSIDKEGVMSVDSSKVTDLLNTDFDSFANFFAAEDEGFAFRLDDYANDLLATDGLIDARQDGLKTKVDGIDDQIARLEDRIISVERRIRAQFTAMDSLVSNLNSTGSFLTQQLANLPSAQSSS